MAAGKGRRKTGKGTLISARSKFADECVKPSYSFDEQKRCTCVYY